MFLYNSIISAESKFSFPSTTLIPYNLSLVYMVEVDMKEVFVLYKETWIPTQEETDKKHKRDGISAASDL